MPKWQIKIATISNRNDMKSQSASDIASGIASESVGKRVEVATEIAMIQIAAIQVTSGLDLKLLMESHRKTHVDPGAHQRGHVSRHMRKHLSKKRSCRRFPRVFCRSSVVRWPDSRESIHGSRTETLFCESRFRGLKNCESQL